MFTEYIIKMNVAAYLRLASFLSVDFTKLKTLINSVLSCHGLSIRIVLRSISIIESYFIEPS